MRECALREGETVDSPEAMQRDGGRDLATEQSDDRGGSAEEAHRQMI